MPAKKTKKSKGTLAAERARAAVQKLEPAQRERLRARAMQLIYEGADTRLTRADRR